MSEALFFVDAIPDGDALALDGPEGHHAATVARLRVGERLLVGDGAGTLVRSVVVSVGKGTVTVSLGAREFTPASSPRIVVAQGIPKGDRGELAVQAMTEVGVDVIIPWSSSRSIARWTSDKPRERWVSTAREAAKQSRRPWLPVVTPLTPTAALTGEISEKTGKSHRGVGSSTVDGVALVLHEEAMTPLSTVELSGAGDIMVIVGPEGGIDPTELMAFEKAGAQAVRLGSNVLRTSTAGVAAVAALNTRLHRW